ncbi:MAG: SDR family NAD(P)-dependent oxidoreductase [Solirubrobacteraceae bacterium]
MAAVNGPRSIAVAGDTDALEELERRCTEDEIEARRVRISYAGHSRHIDALRESVLAGTHGVEPRAGEIPFYSAVTGGVLPGTSLDADYWYRNMRQTIQFQRAVATLLGEGRRSFVEISPHPVLTMGLTEAAEQMGQSVGQETHALCSLRNDEGGPDRMLASLAEAWVRGMPVDWEAIYRDSGARRVSLPRYAFEHRRYWLEPVALTADLSAVGLREAEHPLLGAATSLAGGEGTMYAGRLDLGSHPWLADHALMGSIVLPGAAMLELLLHAGAQLRCDVVSELTFEAPLTLSESPQEAVEIQLIIGGPDERGARSAGVYSRVVVAEAPAHGSRRDLDSDDEGSTDPAWTRNASATLTPSAAAPTAVAPTAAAPTAAAAGTAAGAPTAVAPTAVAQIDAARSCPPPPSSWPPADAEAIELGDFYERLAEARLDYGPAFQGVTAAWRCDSRLYAEIALGERQREHAPAYGMHPALLDACLHSFLAGELERLRRTGEAAAQLPFALGGVRLHARGASALRVCITRLGEGEISLTARDEQDALVLEVGSFVLRPVEAELLHSADDAEQALFRVDWTSLPAPDPGQPAGRDWVVLGSDAWRFAEHSCSGAEPEGGTHVFADIGALVDAIGAGMPPPGTVLACCETTRVRDAAADLPAMAHAATTGALRLLQGWLAEERLVDSRLVLVTREALAVRPGDRPDLPAAALWGLARSAQAEQPGRIVLADVDDAPDRLAALLAGLELDEPQIAVREGVVSVPRLTRAHARPVLAVPDGAPAWRLRRGRGGAIDELRLVPDQAALAPLQPGEVRIAIGAAGINFRDVVVALGLIPAVGEADVLGTEGAGVVLEVGSAVADIEPGDRVMGMVFGAFGPVAVVDRRLIVPIPERWPLTIAGSLPSVFLTALYGLQDLAGLAAGERLLVHAATGGVGLAAIQLARLLGAEVYATASRWKWDLLRALGLPETHIACSRDLEYAARFRQSTGGEGVDVVLNSLAREHVDASLALLRAGGRFIEMGKTDIRDPDELLSRHPRISYRAFDLPEAGPERIQQLLQQTLTLFADGSFTPLPLRTWDVRRAPEAFRFMSQARHTGKVALTIPDVTTGSAWQGERGSAGDGERGSAGHGQRGSAWQGERGSAGDGERGSAGHGPLTAARSRGSALITGGTGQLGALLARHLVGARGIRNLVLASRRGAEAPGAVELREELRASGAEVRIVACEVSERDQLEALLASLPAEQPLRVLIHCAAVVDDGVIGSLDAERVERVLAPKLDAAWHLHELTVELDLQAFVLFSSVAGVFGTPGQGAYAAGNAFLDALAVHRRTLGLPATSIAWGGWQQRSALTATLSEADLMRMERAGLRAFSNEQGLAAFEAALHAADPAITAVRLDLGTLRSLARHDALPALMRRLVRARRPGAAAGGPLLGRLAGTTGRRRRQTLLDFLSGEVATVLGHSSTTATDASRAFKDLGFDSLTALELRNRLNAATGLRLPATLVFDQPTPEALASHLLRLLDGTSAAPAPGAAALRRASADPVAIVGMSCRFPGGVRSAEELWQLLASGVDAIGPLPSDRGWEPILAALDGVAREAREGGFVYDAADFDAAFFGISPREALAMDPQQRLLLEASWEAFEHAGIDPHALRGSETGVYAGVAAVPYGSHVSAKAAEVEGFRLTGMLGSVASGRIAYTFGLEGPTVSVDTACSSSLVAMHMACSALRAGECSLALAGGVTVMTTPDAFVEFARQGSLAGDGRCKSFSASADGAGWGEGVGMIVLERLADARREGHPVLALVRGSAINQDGASNGLTAPSGAAQQRVIARALAAAGLMREDVDAVEAHGTGTTLGDPIEAQALLAAYGGGRPAEQPLWLGSIKSNIGHTQHAAGVAGVIKVVMALRHGVLPRTLHAGEPSSAVDWTCAGLRLLDEEVPWLRNGRPRRAAVSSFGVSGTNAHLILEEAPEAGGEHRDPAGTGKHDAGAAASPPPVLAWILSARGQQALAAHARRVASFAAGSAGPDQAEIALALARRAAFEDRAVVLGGARDKLLSGLRALADGEPAPNLLTGRPSVSGGRLALLFTGQGAQRPRMGHELYRTLPPFASALEQICTELDRHLSSPLLDVLFADAGSPAAIRLDRTELTQAALFAVEAALWRVLERWGVEPEFLIGHSIGELSAAFAAGVLTLEDACRLVAARGRLMGALPDGGAMLAIEASEQEIGERIATLRRSDRAAGEDVSLAAVNSPSSVVLSGGRHALEELAQAMRDEGRKVKRLRVSHAFHSPLMEPMLTDFAEVASSVSYAEPRIPIVSNLTGRPTEELSSAGYWVDQVRKPVRFADGVRWLLDEGVGSFLELGPDAVLSGMASECIREAGETRAGDALALAALRSGRPEASTLIGSLAELWTRGAQIDWQAPLRQAGATTIAIPSYPFQRRRYWLEGGLEGAGSPAGDAYEVAWTPVAGEPAALSGRWLVALPSGCRQDSWVASVLGLLGEHGAELVSVLCDTAGDPRASLREQLREVPAVDGVISLLALAQSERADLLGVAEGLDANLALAQSLPDAGIPAPLWLITREAVAASASDRSPSPAQAQTWGLGAALALEHPQRWGGLLDLPHSLDERAGALLVAAVRGLDGEDQLALRGAGLLARRLRRSSGANASAAQEAGWRPPAGTVLVTGGTGGLGAAIARRFAARGAEHLLLVSRRGMEAPGASELDRELRERGCAVTIAACDVAERESLAATIASLPAELPLRAVVHAAGVDVRGPLASLEPAELQRALAAKARGAQNLDELTRELDLGAFVLISSIAGVLGSGLMAAYCAANASLDALAMARRGRGAPSTSIAFGPLHGAGMVAADVHQQALRGQGLELIGTDRAVEALERALLRDEACPLIAGIRWETYAALYTARRRRPLIEEIPEVRRLNVGAPAGQAGAPTAVAPIVERLRSAPRRERPRIALELVRTEVARVLGHDSSLEIDPRRTFKDMGFESLTAVELRSRLQAATGLGIPATLVFDHPTPEAAAKHVLTLLAKGAPDAELSLDDELTKLEGSVAGMADGAERRRVAERLQALIASLEDRRLAAQEQEQATAILQRIESASDEEMFELIDQNFDTEAER